MTGWVEKKEAGLAERRVDSPSAQGVHHEAGPDPDDLLSRGKSSLSRSAKPDPRPRRRYRASKQEWADMHLVFRGSPCRVCGEPFQSLHHILPRGQGGDDVIVNLAPVCGGGTSGCHGKLEARDPETRAALRRNLVEANRWYLTGRLGERAVAWLDRNYPDSHGKRS